MPRGWMPCFRRNEDLTSNSDMPSRDHSTARLIRICREWGSAVKSPGRQQGRVVRHGDCWLRHLVPARTGVPRTVR